MKKYTLLILTIVLPWLVGAQTQTHLKVTGNVTKIKIDGGTTILKLNKMDCLGEITAVIF